MSKKWPYDENLEPFEKFFHALGVATVGWNETERCFSRLIWAYLGTASYQGQVVTHNMSNERLTHLLRRIANHTEHDPAIRKELNFAATLFSKNRINRNWLSHGKFAILNNKGKKQAIYRVEKHFEKVTFEDYLLEVKHIRQTADEFSTALRFIKALKNGIFDPLDDRYQLASLPERPPLPEPLNQNVPPWRPGH